MRRAAAGVRDGARRFGVRVSRWPRIERLLRHDPPQVLIIDEPIVGLDPRSARLIKDLLKLKARQGTTVFMSSHLLEVVDELCDRIAIIQGGVIRASGTMADLRASAESGTMGLEEIFLKLTGENAARELIDVLDA